MKKGVSDILCVFLCICECLNVIEYEEKYLIQGGRIGGMFLLILSSDTHILCYMYGVNSKRCSMQIHFSQDGDILCLEDEYDKVCL